MVFVTTCNKGCVGGVSSVMSHFKNNLIFSTFGLKMASITLF